MKKKKYFKDIDKVRVFACICILLYHLNILKGGYLAVCTFFVLSGYLSCISLAKKDNSSLKDYYINKFKHLYLPMIYVIFLSIAFSALFKDLIWLNLKTETTSLLLGYNNFWQLGANLDYFAGDINSPFIHLWYIAIILQFDLIFPFIFKFFKKMGDTLDGNLPIVVSTIVSIGFTIYFYIMSFSSNMMNVYYNTFTRLFSLLFGVTLGFYTIYKGTIVFRYKKLNIVVFYGCLLALFVMNVFIGPSSKIFALGMILTSIISMILVNFGSINTDELDKKDKVINYVASISYDMYLLQEPGGFFLQEMNITGTLKIVVTIVLTLILSMILHSITNIKKEKFKSKKVIMFIILWLLTLFGIGKFVLTENHTAEMKELEEQLAQNEILINQDQEDYLEQLKKNEEEWQAILDEIENGEKDISKLVVDLPITGVGDSVLLGAVANLKKQFPNSYWDAKVSRSILAINPILEDLKKENKLGDPVVINAGANGDCSESCKKKIIETCGDREIFWLTVTNDKKVKINDKLKELEKEYKNLHVIDWEEHSKPHVGEKDYFYADGIHLAPNGRKDYTQFICDSIVQVYTKKYKNLKDEKIKEHEDELRNKLGFFGNDLLFYSFKELKKSFEKDDFNIKQDYTFNILKDDISKLVESNVSNNRLVLVFDHSLSLTTNQYESLFDIAKDKEVYVVVFNSTMKDKLSKITSTNIKLIEFDKELEKHDDYLMKDNIHLTEKGNSALRNIIEATFAN